VDELIAEQPSLSPIQTDANVPDGHRGLHSFLYDDGKEDDAHAAKPAGSRGRVRFDGVNMYGVDRWLGMHREERVCGVYSVLDEDRSVQYVGVSRNVAVALESHRRQTPPGTVAFVRIKSWDYPRREEMDALRDEWIRESGRVPPGNEDASLGFAETIKDASTDGMKDDERQQYHDNKLKLRRAMADNTLIDETPNIIEEEIMNREALLHALKDDDWSAVIDGQTNATLNPQLINAQLQEALKIGRDDTSTDTQGEANVVSPFAPGRQGDDAVAARTAEPAESLPLTVDNVDRVLDDVRPYLQADGGNVMVVAVDPTHKTISLALQGACGNCPSSQMTLKMGIERLLKETWPDLNDVVPVSDPSSPHAAPAPLPFGVELIERHLEEVRWGLNGMGASCDVIEAKDGRAVLRYAGPDPGRITFGIELMLKDAVPNNQLQVVEFVTDEPQTDDRQQATAA